MASHSRFRHLLFTSMRNRTQHAEQSIVGFSRHEHTWLNLEIYGKLSISTCFVIYSDHTSKAAFLYLSTPYYLGYLLLVYFKEIYFRKFEHVLKNIYLVYR